MASFWRGSSFKYHEAEDSLRGISSNSPRLASTMSAESRRGGVDSSPPSCRGLAVVEAIASASICSICLISKTDCMARFRVLGTCSVSSSTPSPSGHVSGRASQACFASLMLFRIFS
eukprot:Skav232082  [mRNA]  locus=scaffold5800:101989:108671:- [translate_table: standard]